MVTLIAIRREYDGRDELPWQVQGLANAAMIGVIYCNGFAGRSGEWCVLKLQDFRFQMKKNKNYVVCQKHKTSHVYGDLAKWLADGTREAMCLYAELPRRVDIETFFHPAHAGVRTVDVHHALKKFGEKFLPDCPQKPTVNLMRKWYHTKLMTMSKTEGELFQLMVRIDAHSQRVAERHYVLRNPKHDAELAKILVGEVMGTTVPWPTELRTMPWSQFMEKIKVMPPTVNATEGTEAPEVPDDPSEEEELQWFDLADKFGLPRPMVPLPDATSEQVATDDETTPLHALAAYDAPPVELSEPSSQSAVSLSPTDPPAAQPSGPHTPSLTGARRPSLMELLLPSEPRDPPAAQPSGPHTQSLTGARRPSLMELLLPSEPTDPPAAQPSGPHTQSLTGARRPTLMELLLPSEPTEAVSQDSVVEVPPTVTPSHDITADAPRPSAAPMPRDVSPDQRTLRELPAVKFVPRPTPQAPAWSGLTVSPPQAYLQHIFAKQSPVRAKRTAEPKRTAHSAPMPSPPDDVSVIQSSPGTPRAARSRSPSRPATAPTPRSTPQRSGGERSRSRTRPATTPPGIRRDDRRYRYSDEEVAYILHAHEAFPRLKPASWFNDLLLKGRMTGHLSMEATSNGMRSIVSRHLARREEERQREAIALAKARARHLRNERRRQQYAEGSSPA